jgi:para-nitrobenzyl esterase
MTVTDPEVHIGPGRVRGRSEDGAAVFRGIPFAQPPAGELRFAAPRPPRPWDGVRDAGAFGPPAPQSELGLSPAQPPPPGTDPNDWLTLNVWTPDPGAAGLPVMVWIHGGAYRAGSSSEPTYDGIRFARSGVVLVTCNYRLGVEGYAQIEGAPANRALLDQVAALRWVAENIGAFGGDPGNVTVFGESAGAGAIAALLVMDAARGLFRRAIAQSVPGTFFSPDLAADITAAIAAEAGVRPGLASFAAVPPQRLVAAADVVTTHMRDHVRWGPVAYIDTPFSPVADGEVLPRAPWRALLSGAARNVDLIAGHNRDEYRLFTEFSGRRGKITAEDADAALHALAPAPDGAAHYRAAYPAADAEELYELVYSDWLFRMPSLHLAQAHAVAGGRTFLYELRYPAPAGDGALGACHGLDVPLLFGALGAGIALMLAGERPPASFTALGDLMRSEWVAFARSGGPGWPAYSAGRRLARLYDDPASVDPYPENASMHLWERHQFGALDLRDG